MNLSEKTKGNLLFFLPALLVLCFFIFFHHRLTHIIVPICIGLLVASWVTPIVRMIQKKTHFPRVVSLVIGYLILLGGIVAAFSFLIPALINNLKGIIDNGGSIEKSLSGIVDTIYGWTRSDSPVSGWVRDSLDSAIGKIQDIASRMLENLVQYSMQVISYIIDIITGFILAYYFLKDGAHIRNWALSLFPYTWRTSIAETSGELGKIAGQFLQGQLMLALLVGIMETVGLWMLQVPFALMLGIIGGISNIIPYFGPFIGAVPAILAALLVSPQKAIWVALLFFVVQQVDNNFISPRVIEGKMGIHPIATILAVFIGGEFFGLMGILLAIPVYAMFRCILRRIVKSREPAISQNLDKDLKIK